MLIPACPHYPPPPPPCSERPQGRAQPGAVLALAWAPRRQGARGLDPACP